MNTNDLWIGKNEKGQYLIGCDYIKTGNSNYPEQILNFDDRHCLIMTYEETLFYADNEDIDFYKLPDFGVAEQIVNGSLELSELIF